jgi:hypothetical protein
LFSIAPFFDATSELLLFAVPGALERACVREVAQRRVPNAGSFRTHVGFENIDAQLALKGGASVVHVLVLLVSAALIAKLAIGLFS